MLRTHLDQHWVAYNWGSVEKHRRSPWNSTLKRKEGFHELSGGFSLCSQHSPQLHASQLEFLGSLRMILSSGLSYLHVWNSTRKWDVAPKVKTRVKF